MLSTTANDFGFRILLPMDIDPDVECLISLGGYNYYIVLLSHNTIHSCQCVVEIIFIGLPLVATNDRHFDLVLVAIIS